MDMEDAPPTSDADVCISTTTSSTRMASSAVSGGAAYFQLSHFSFTFATNPYDTLLQIL